MPRSRLGPLAIESPLGRHPDPVSSGVWRAVHVSLRRSLAVRIFPVMFGGTMESRQGFAAEWERLKALDHPAIAKCFGGGLEGVDAYLAHELLEGPTLADELQRQGRLPWERVLELAEPLADALAYLHDHQIIHGRIDPEKIIIAGLSPVLVDVRAEDGSAPFRGGPYHRSGGFTPQQWMYRPPESPGPHDAMTVQGDLYGLGATLYHALTGTPPVTGSNVQEIRSNLNFQNPIGVSSTVMEVPIWMDRLVMQLLQKDPAKRPPSAVAVKLQLAEVRKCAMSGWGVAQHAAKFSPLAITNEADKQIAKSLLGVSVSSERGLLDTETPAWHDRSWLLVSVLTVILGCLAYVAWPMSEDTLRERAEAMLADDSRASLSQAKRSYLQPMLRNYPDGRHAVWANEQIDRVEMIEAEHALKVKLNRNLPLQNEAERLCAEAMRYEAFGDDATAMDKYQSMVTLLSGNGAYRPLVNLARSKIARISVDQANPSEAAMILAEQLREAETYFVNGNVIAARKIWYSVVELYADNAAVTPWVSTAQDRLAETSAGLGVSKRP